MTSEELAEETERIISCAQSRILGTGKNQYSTGGTQKFEEMTPLDLLDEAQDEILDLINYSVMTYIRVERIKQTINNT